MKELPNTLHGLLTVALDDLEKVMKDDRYSIYMGFWHSPITEENNKCNVCLAGCVMAKTLGACHLIDLHPICFWKANKLYAIESIRVGDFVRALFYLSHFSNNEELPFHSLLYEFSNKSSVKRKIREIEKRIPEITPKMRLKPQDYLVIWREVATKLKMIRV